MQYIDIGVFSLAILIIVRTYVRNGSMIVMPEIWIISIVTVMLWKLSMGCMSRYTHNDEGIVVFHVFYADPVACGICREGGFIAFFCLLSFLNILIVRTVYDMKLSYQQKIPKPELTLSRGLLIMTIPMSMYKTAISPMR